MNSFLEYLLGNVPPIFQLPLITIRGLAQQWNNIRLLMGKGYTSAEHTSKH